VSLPWHRARSPMGTPLLACRYKGAWGFRFWEQHAGRERERNGVYTILGFFLFN
jgi:hypothetical protein